MDVEVLFDLHQIARVDLVRDGVGHAADEPVVEIGPDVVAFQERVHSREG